MISSAEKMTCCLHNAKAEIRKTTIRDDAVWLRNSGKHAWKANRDVLNGIESTGVDVSFDGLFMKLNAKIVAG